MKQFLTKSIISLIANPQLRKCDKNICKKIILLTTFILFSNLGFSQKYLTDERCINLIKDHPAYILNDNKVASDRADYNNSQPTNIIVTKRYSDNSPKIVEFDYLAITKEKFYGDRSPKKKFYGTICLYFAQGFPILYYNKKNKASNSKYNYGYDAQYPDSPQITDKVYTQFKNDLLQENMSYQQVINRHNNYPIESNPKGCLNVIYKIQEFQQVYLDIQKVNFIDRDGDVIGPAPSNINFKTGEAIKKAVPYFINKCDHQIIIKGINKKSYGSKTGVGSEYEYFDDSFALAPNQIHDYFAFTSEWNDDSQYDLQYISDPGYISNLSKTNEFTSLEYQANELRKK